MSTSIIVAAALDDHIHGEECLRTIQNYDARTATVQQMQYYSNCVNRLHPENHAMSPEGIMAIKVMIIIALISGGVTTYRDRSAHYNYADSLLIFVLVSVVSFAIMFLFMIIIAFMVS